MITFTSRMDVERSMMFDQEYEPELQMDVEEKRELLEVCRGQVVYIFFDGRVIGETYGATPAELYAHEDKKIPGVNKNENNSVYCYSTTIVGAYQGFGFGQLLKAYWLGLCKARNFKRVVGHATNDAAAKLNNKFGAVWFQGKHYANWYGTQRTAHYYEIEL